MKMIKKDNLVAYIFPTRKEMGAAAARCAADAINEVLRGKEYANVVFAAAPSQNETLEALLAQNVDFSRINAFHMDEYVGLGINDRQSFATYLTEHIFAKVKFHSVNIIPATLPVDEACAEYTRLLAENPVDVVLLGIGENGHIAFNDPPVADFNDKKVIKRVELDEKCRMQQVHDGCFPDFDSVPKYALTLTIPTMMSARYMICTVPAITKADAVYGMLHDEISEACPATVLRRHSGASVFLDTDSASKL